MLKQQDNVKYYFTDWDDEKLNERIDAILNADWTKDCFIAFMPDTHPTENAVVGLTIALKDKVNVNYVSADIGCGVSYVKLSKRLTNEDFKKIDEVCYGNHFEKVCQDTPLAHFDRYNDLHCKAYISVKQADLGLATLGNGNHFIEVGRGKDADYLVIHSGSRNLGGQVFKYYRNLQNKKQQDRFFNVMDFKKELKALLFKYKKQQWINEFFKLTDSKNHKMSVGDELHYCYLEGNDFKEYIDDLQIVNEYAELNRKTMTMLILDKLGLSNDISSLKSNIHNIVGADNILRKGSIVAKNHIDLIIPLNMKDGCILGVSKDLDGWNDSAPHGSGRFTSRRKIKQELTMDDFIKDMKGIYSTTISEKTLDESPRAYKDTNEILHNLKNVEVKEIIKTIYNYKNDGETHL